MLFPWIWSNYAALVAYYCTQTFSRQIVVPLADAELFWERWQFLRRQFHTIRFCEGPCLEIDEPTRKKMLRVASFALRKLEPQGELLVTMPNAEQMLDSASYSARSAAAVALSLCAQAFAELMNKCPQVFHSSGDDVTLEYITELQRDIQQLLAFVDAMLELWQRCLTVETIDIRPCEQLFRSLLARTTTSHYTAIQMRMALSLDVAASAVLDQLTYSEEMPL